MIRKFARTDVVRQKNHGFRAYDFLDWFPCHKLDCVAVNEGKNLLSNELQHTKQQVVLFLWELSTVILKLNNRWC
jgi:hypothetical protein